MYHIWIDGKGYMLSTRPDGRLATAARVQRTDPWTRHVTSEELWKLATFTFENGAGASRTDERGRYRRGKNIDTRGGSLILGPPIHLAEGYTSPILRPAVGGGVQDIVLSNLGGDVDGYGMRFTVPAGKTQLDAVHVLVRRLPGAWNWTAGNLVVSVHVDAAGPRPGAVVGTLTLLPDRAPGDKWRWIGNPWGPEEYFWAECRFAAPVAVVAGNPYWLTIINATQYKLHWGRNLSQTCTISTYDGAAWAAGYSGLTPYHSIKFYDEIDSWAVDFEEFEGADTIRRVYAAVGNKVLYYDPGTNTWSVSKGDFAYEVEDLILFNERLFAAQGPNASIAHHTGASATTVWTVLPDPHEAQCLAVHDRYLWKAKEAEVQASETGLNADWGSNTCIVGDPGTWVTAMVSHGGKLLAAKAEGIFEISYPEDYPDTGEPVANLVLDFRTDKAERAWLLDWHSGLFFPGTAGLFAWQGGILRDLWGSMAEEGLELAHPVDMLDEIEQGLWLGAAGTTRGLWSSLMSPHLMQGSLWFYRSQTWHPLWQEAGYQGEYPRAVYYWSYGAGRGRLFMSLGSNIGYFNIPSWTDDRSLDSNSDFVTYGECELAEFDDGDPRMLKAWCKLGVTSREVSLGVRDVVVKYAIDDLKGDPTWVYLGTVSASPYAELEFPAGTTGRAIRLLVAVSGPGTSTPIVERVVLFFQLLPCTIVTHQVTVRVSDHTPLLTGGTDPRTAAEVWAELEALDAAAAPVVYRDVLGVDHSVRAVGATLLSSRIVKQPVPGLSGAGVEAEAVVTLVETECGGA